MGLRLKVEIVEMKEFHAKILFLVQPFSTHEHLAPKFGRAANFFRFYIIKIAKVGLRMKVEIVGIKVFYDKIFLFKPSFFRKLTFSLMTKFYF